MRCHYEDFLNITHIQLFLFSRSRWFRMTQGMMAAHCKIPDQMDDGLLLAKLLNFCSVLSAMVDFFLPQYRTWYSCRSKY